MTDKMPMNIWVYDCPQAIGDLGFAINHKEDEYEQYTNTAQAIEAIRGMMKEPMHNNTTLQDVIDMLEKE